MAGNTTRLLFTSTSSLVAVCLSLIWYLRKKKLLALDSSVKKTNASEINIPKSGTVIDIASMNLKELSEPTTTQQPSNSQTSEKMHIKGKSELSDLNEVQACSNGSTVNGICNQSCENIDICVTQTLTNGSSHPSKCDNAIDNHCSMSKVENKNKSSEMNGSNNVSEVINGINSLSFTKDSTMFGTKDTVCEVVQNASSDSDNEDVSKFEDSKTTTVFTNQLHNGDSQCTAELCENMSTNKLSSDLSSNEVFSMDLVNRSSIDLSCETNFERKTLTPDSGVPGDLQECDSSSSMSDHSSEFPLNGTHSDILKSPCVSESSNDSGKTSLQNFDGGEVPGDESLYYEQETAADPMHYDFSIPQELCGYLIGKLGRHVKYLIEETNAAININIHPFLKNYKVCTISGAEEEIKHALALIREKFPLERYPDLSLEALNPVQTECTLPVTICLALPEGVTFEVLLSATITPGHFFLQQPSHPTYHTLSWLTQTMTTWYSQCDAPKLFKITVGHVVAAPMCGGWYRAEVTHLNTESNDCTVKFLDFGGYSTLSTSELRQMKFEFAYIPFQAVECFLGNVSYPEDEDGWSDQAKSLFEDLAQGQILHGYIVAYDEGIPCVHLYKIQGATHTFINREIVNEGLARWIEH